MYDSETIDHPRFTAWFQRETKSFGFLMEPEGVDNAQLPKALPTIEGEPGGIFLSRKEAEKALGRRNRNLLMAMEVGGRYYNFAIRLVPEGKHAGKMVAFDVQTIVHHQDI